MALRSFGQPNAVVRQFDFWDTSYEWRRLFSELFGTFLLVTVGWAAAWSTPASLARSPVRPARWLRLSW